MSVSNEKSEDGVSFLFEVQARLMKDNQVLGIVKLQLTQALCQLGQAHFHSDKEARMIEKRQDGASGEAPRAPATLAHLASRGSKFFLTSVP